MATEQRAEQREIPRAVRLPSGDMWRPNNGVAPDSVAVPEQPLPQTQEEKIASALEEAERLGLERQQQEGQEGKVRPVCPWCDQDFADPDRLRVHMVHKHQERVKDDLVQEQDAMRAMARRQMQGS
jgi:hypothetical protein